MRRRTACICALSAQRWLLLAVVVILGLTAPAVASSSSGRDELRDGFGPAPIGAHSMLYLNTPFSAMKAMFAQASEMGASDIRVNIEVSSVFPGPAQTRQRSALTPVARRAPPIQLPSRNGGAHSHPLAHPQWTGVNRYLRLARTYHLHVLAVLTSTPAWMARCPRGTRSNAIYRCPPDPRDWGRAVAEIAAHTGGVIDSFEVLNEPDGRWSFLGSPQQYAAVLAASYNAIHTADPTARVVLGGLMHVGTLGQRWMDAMLATQGSDAVHKFDVANLHLRVVPTQVPTVTCQWEGYLAAKGFSGPLWVTETGYPANRAEQSDPGYETGPRAQAHWLTATVPAMLASGVEKVFVTERDLSRGQYASEGVLQAPNPLPASPHIRRRPSFYAVQRLARMDLLPSGPGC
jgi:polysaccharide biosynthesis protein PslG